MVRMVLCIGFLLILPLAAQVGSEHWVATWGTSQQLYTTGPRVPGPSTPNPQRRFGIPAPLASISNQTVRMIAQTSLGGERVRIRLQNAFGMPAVAIGAVHIALRSSESGIVAGTDRVLTFSGQTTALLYGGETLISDPVNLKLPALSHVAVSIYIPGETAAPANHRFALHTTYISKEGNLTASTDIPDAITRESWYWLAGIDVLAPASTGALVTFGDSITDGDQSTPETDGMWPAIVAAHVPNVGVVNAGISGNRVLGDNGGGLVRFDRDALAQPGIKWVSILEGINDITGNPQLSADTLIAAYRQMIEAAHEYGVRVIGCTLTPYGGSNVYTDHGESVRTAVNDWIRNSRAFDAVVDFDAATRDPSDPKRFRPEADSPDMLHPANPGYKLMGEAFAAVFTKEVSAASRATRQGRR